MDSQLSGIIAITSIAVSIGGVVIASINHKRLRSNCCGKNLEASFDIESTQVVMQAATQAAQKVSDRDAPLPLPAS